MGVSLWRYISLGGHKTGEKVAVQSTMMPLRTQAPNFRLPSLQGQVKNLGDFDESPALLVMFICNHCPFVRHIESELGKVVSQYEAKGLAAVGICSSDIGQHPEDAEEGLEEQAERAGFSFPYLIDDGQYVAHDYGAACTPDFFLFGPDRTLVYRGRFDSTRPGSDEPVTGEDLTRAIEAVLGDEEVDADQHPSMGCAIAWKPGNEPK